MFKIGNIEIKNNIVMAPMAGISNAAYMKICEEMGVGYAITELISAEAIVRDNKKTLDMLKGYEELNIPVAIQLFGANPVVMAKAAQIASKTYQFKIIDINMGCPVPKVATRSNAGSALLKDPKLVYKIVKNVVDTVAVPVTVKIRSGWDKNSVNAIEIAQEIEKAGAKAIAIHGRTRAQGYTGNVDLDVIKKVKAAVSIPVIGNGDIKSKEDVKYMLDYTKCDAVMIGRAIIGNPWLIKECVNYLNGNDIKKEIRVKDKIDMIKKHINLLAKIKTEKQAILEIRMHIARYLRGLFGSKELKQKIFKTTSKEEIIQILDEFSEGYCE